MSLDHRPVIVKRALIGSKCGRKLRTISILKIVRDRSIIKNYVNYAYFLDGNIFSALFETAYHCFC